MIFLRRSPSKTLSDNERPPSDKLSVVGFAASNKSPKSATSLSFALTSSPTIPELSSG
eukprot:CAMPEP_0185762050 /NCGR_PEP_ID=MMETSP1174-20130828/21014_1 /TAXON_ID=35687 /ORGANISM="Dictyocha speculum, Strain CCMP1381" /LENGTH=57 /DNA_ID=CAMNT_0028443543 /DNA_START=85 /DNA_END=254 /DNA_ORIENTATION=+